MMQSPPDLVDAEEYTLGQSPTGMLLESEEEPESYESDYEEEEEGPWWASPLPPSAQPPPPAAASTIPGQSLFLENLPPEVLVGIVNQSPVGGPEIGALRNTSRRLRGAAQYVTSVRRAQAMTQLRAPGAICATYANCLLGVVEAIVRDDSQQLVRLLVGGVVDPRQPIMLAIINGQASGMLRAWRTANAFATLSDYALDAFALPIRGLYDDAQERVELPGAILYGRTVSGWLPISLINLAASLVAPKCLEVLVRAGARPLPDRASSAINDAIGAVLPARIRWHDYTRSPVPEHQGDETTRFVPTTKVPEQRYAIRVTPIQNVGQVPQVRESALVEIIDRLLYAFPDRFVPPGQSPADGVYGATLAALHDASSPVDRAAALQVGLGVARSLVSAGYPFAGTHALAGVYAFPSPEASEAFAAIDHLASVPAISVGMTTYATAVAQDDYQRDQDVRDLFETHPQPYPTLWRQLEALIENDRVDPLTPLDSAFASAPGPADATGPWRRLQWGLTSPLAPTLLDLAAYYHNRQLLSTIEAALAGQTPLAPSPWPTPESTLNGALYSMRTLFADEVPVRAREIPNQTAADLQRVLDTVYTVLHVLERSPQLAPLDVNPLTVARNSLWLYYSSQMSSVFFRVRYSSDDARAKVLIRAVGQSVADAASTLMAALIGYGYTPRERMAAVPHPAVNGGIQSAIAARPFDTANDFPASVSGDAYAHMASESELDGLDADMDRAARSNLYSVRAVGIPSILAAISNAYLPFRVPVP